MVEAASYVAILLEFCGDKFQNKKVDKNVLLTFLENKVFLSNGNE